MTLIIALQVISALLILSAVIRMIAMFFRDTTVSAKATSTVVHLAFIAYGCVAIAVANSVWLSWFIAFGFASVMVVPLIMGAMALYAISLVKVYVDGQAAAAAA